MGSCLALQVIHIEVNGEHSINKKIKLSSSYGQEIRDLWLLKYWDEESFIDTKRLSFLTYFLQVVLTFRATRDRKYLTLAESLYKKYYLSSSWAFSWDDKTAAVQMLLYGLTKKPQYKLAIQKYLANWLPGKTNFRSHIVSYNLQTLNNISLEVALLTKFEDKLCKSHIT